MTVKELEKYRVQLFRDATLMERKPDRVPHLANFWTWQILDAGYTFTEATHDYEIMEKVMRTFHERYGFDGYQETGIRNPQRVTETLGTSQYIFDDVRETITIKDFTLFEPDEYDLLIADPVKFIWETILPRKFELSTAKCRESAPAVRPGAAGFYNASFQRNRILAEEYGVPHLIAPFNGFISLGIEFLLPACGE